MRAYVCGQCHVEYYFKGPQKRLVYPWAKGLKVEQITAYYDEIGFRDWTHKDTGAPALKAQHPEFETWSQGPHARAGVTCADCHMPTISTSLTDHWVRSPHAEREGRLRRLPQEARREGDRGGPAGARLRDPGPALGASREGDDGRGRADRRPEGGEGRGAEGRGSPRRPLPAAALAVLSRLRRGGELHRLPRAAGGGAHPRRVDRLRAPGPDRAARPGVQADRAGGQHSATRRPRSPEARWPGNPQTNRSARPARPAGAHLAAAAQPERPLVGVRARRRGRRDRRHRDHRHPGDGPRHGHRRVLRQRRATRCSGSRRNTRTSIHGATRTGMRATCHDCHIPREYPELLWYKAVAGTKDVIGEMRGVIATEEKFQARAQAHGRAGVGRIQGQRLARVPRLPRVLRRKCSRSSRKWCGRSTRRCSRASATCIDCHKGVGHPAP